MQKMEKTGRIFRYLWIGVIVGIFLFAFVLNCWTPYVADDFDYFFSFADKSRITSVGQVFTSMYAHAFTMNGRLAPHFLVQVFGMMPKVIFNFCNAFMFAFLFYRIAKNAEIDGSHRLDAVCYIGIFAAYWWMIPLFGQVNLWFDGSLNYLWSLALAMAYLAPYFRFLTEGAWKASKYSVVGYAVLSFFFGNFSENTSMAAIGGSILVLLAAKILYKYRIPKALLLNIGLAFISYVVIYLCPAQIANKAGSGGLSAIIENIYDYILVFVENGKWLLVVWGLLAIWGLYNNMSRKKLLLSFICILMAIAANFIFIFASYYPERSMCGMMIFLIQADVILLAELRNTKQEFLTAMICFCICFRCISPVVQGVWDIYYVHKQSVEREYLIESQISAGKTDLAFPRYEYSTRYAGCCELRDVVFDTTTWPNKQMAWYYGVNSVIRD